MNRNEKSIVLISEDSALNQRLEGLLAGEPVLVLNQCPATLAQMNGKAQEMAQSTDLIIFRPEADLERDLAALEGIRASGGQARLLALSSGDVSLSQARRLIRAGVAEVVPDTVDDLELGQVVNRLTVGRRLTLAALPEPRGTVIAVAKARGGVGATTLATNLAFALRGPTRRFGKGVPRAVVLLDLDVQFGTVAGFVDVAPNEALFRMALDGIEPDSFFVEQSVEVAPSGLSVLAAPEGFMPLGALQPAQIAGLIAALRARFDFVVIDLPQAMVEWLVPVLEAADRLYLACDASVPCVQQARRLIDFYHEANMALPVEVVISQGKKPLLPSRRISEAAKVLEQPFRHWLPSDPKHATEAMDRGRPLAQVARGAALTRAIGKIAKDLTTRLAGDTRPDEKRS